MADSDDKKIEQDTPAGEKQKPARRPRYTLEELLAGITPENCHGEVCFGRAVGREFPNEEEK